MGFSQKYSAGDFYRQVVLAGRKLFFLPLNVNLLFDNMTSVNVNTF
jgi:hypothetical protein